MLTPKIWLLAAALTLSAEAALAANPGEAECAGPADAECQALADARAAARRGDLPPRIERREVRVYRSGRVDEPGETLQFRGDRSGHLRDLLQLRPEQEPALKVFVDATQPAGPGKDGMVKFERGADRTTLQRLDDMQARLAEQQTEASRRIAAIRAFYGQLDARQQKAFDAMPMLMMVGPSMGPMVIPGGTMRISRRSERPPAPPAPPRPPKSPAQPKL